jgi:hypothetical protein
VRGKKGMKALLSFKAFIKDLCQKNLFFRWVLLPILLISGIVAIYVSSYSIDDWFFDRVDSKVPINGCLKETSENMNFCSSLIETTRFWGKVDPDKKTELEKCNKCFMYDERFKVTVINPDGILIEEHKVLNVRKGLINIGLLIASYLSICLLSLVPFYLWSVRQSLWKLILVFWDKEFLIKIALILFIFFIIIRMFPKE